MTKLNPIETYRALQAATHRSVIAQGAMAAIADLAKRPRPYGGWPEVRELRRAYEQWAGPEHADADDVAAALAGGQVAR